MIRRQPFQIWALASSFLWNNSFSILPLIPHFVHKRSPAANSFLPLGCTSNSNIQNIKRPVQKQGKCAQEQKLFRFEVLFGSALAAKGSDPAAKNRVCLWKLQCSGGHSSKFLVRPLVDFVRVNCESPGSKIDVNARPIKSDTRAYIHISKRNTAFCVHVWLITKKAKWPEN